MGAEWIDDWGARDDLRFHIGRDLICTADARGYFVTLNAAWETVLGWSREELLSRPFIEFVHPDDVEATRAQAAKIGQRDYEVVGFENRFRTRDGAYRWLHWSARSDGEMWFSVAYDVTESKRAEERLREAIADRRLLAYSQPIVEPHSRRVVQEELLVRLRSASDVRRIVAPSEFLPEAERYGSIALVDEWMAGQAIELASRGQPAEVNLSGQSIADDDLTRELERELRAAGDGASKIVFEITETAAIEHVDAARAFVQRLAPLGCQFALDDFGTGFASLTYLRHLPVDMLKIDISFVRDATADPGSRAVVRSIVATAKEFGRRTVAEGVEDERTLRMMRDYGVDFAQGFLIGRPRPVTAGAAPPG